MKAAPPNRRHTFSSARSPGIRSLGSTLTALVGSTALLSVPVSADTTFLLEIDSDQSEITQNCLSGCEPGPFFIGGRFQVRVWDQDRGFGNLDLADVSVETEALDPGPPFAFPAIDAALEGVELTGDANACHWPGSGSGTCISSGRFDSFSGTFDGSSLQITGIDYQTSFNKPSYSYTILANVVPEPSPALLVAMALFVLISLRRHRSEIPSA